MFNPLEVELEPQKHTGKIHSGTVSTKKTFNRKKSAKQNSSQAKTPSRADIAKAKVLKYQIEEAKSQIIANSKQVGKPSGVTSQHNKDTSSDHHTFMGMNDSRDRFNNPHSHPSQRSGRTIEPANNTLTAYRSSLPTQPDPSQRLLQQKLSHTSLQASSQDNIVLVSQNSQTRVGSFAF